MLAWACSTTSRSTIGSARLSSQRAAAGHRRVVRVGLVEDHRELVAAEPGEQVRRLQLRQRRGEPLHHRLQQLVAGRVPEGVVDLLEVVEVDQREREAGAAAAAGGAGSGAAAVQRGVQRAAVGGAGQLVGQRQLRGRRRARAAGRKASTSRTGAGRQRQQGQHRGQRVLRPAAARRPAPRPCSPRPPPTTTSERAPGSGAGGRRPHAGGARGDQHQPDRPQRVEPGAGDGSCRRRAGRRRRCRRPPKTSMPTAQTTNDRPLPRPTRPRAPSDGRDQRTTAHTG